MPSSKDTSGQQFFLPNPFANRELKIAPVPVLVSHLAVCHRALTAIHKFGHEQDVEGIFLGGWLADTLHNVPEMLTCAGAAQNRGGIWSEVDSSGFSDLLSGFGASQRILAESMRITSPENAAADLGLIYPDEDVCVAPANKFAEYSYVLYLAFCFIRKRKPLDSWTQEDTNHGITGAAVAHVLGACSQSSGLLESVRRTSILPGLFRCVPTG